MAKKAEIRSRRRASPGWRSLLALILVLILLLLIGRIIGWRIGGESPSHLTADERSLTSSDEGDLRVDPVRARPTDLIGRSHADRNALETEAGDREPEAIDSTPTSVVEGGFLHGPSWLRFILPPDFDLDRTKILVEAVHADLPGLRGKKVLRATSRRAPGEIILLLDSVPGGVWIELHGDGVRELQGPFATEPFEFRDLGALQHPSATLSLPDEREGLFVRPRPVPPPGAKTAWLMEGLPDDRSGPITTRAELMADETLILRGPYELCRPRRPEILTEENSASFVPDAPGALLVRQPMDLERFVIRRHEKGEFRASVATRGDVRILQPCGGEARLPVVLHPGYSDIIGKSGSLSLRRDQLALMRPFRDDENRLPIATRDALALDLLLFDLDSYPADPSDPERVLIPVFYGDYEIVPLQESLETLEAPLEMISVTSETPLRFDFDITTDAPRVEGLVLDAETGRPIAGAAIFVGRSEFEPPMWLPLGQRSDEEGRFTSRGLPTSPVVVFARADGFEPRSTRIDPSRAPDQTVVIHLSRAPGVEIRVRDQQGKALRIDAVLAVGRGGTRNLAEVGEDGSARFAGLSPDRYVFLPVIGRSLEQVDDWNWLERESGGLVLDHPAVGLEPPTMTLPRPRRFILDIRTSGGAPGPFDLHLVTTENPPAPGFFPRILKTAVGPGKLAIDGLPPGRYRAVASQGLTSALADFVVSPEDDAIIPLVLEFD